MYMISSYMLLSLHCMPVASSNGIPFGLAFQSSAMIGGVFDLICAVLYATIEGKWNTYFTACFNWRSKILANTHPLCYFLEIVNVLSKTVVYVCVVIVIYPIVGILLRLMARLILRFLASTQDSVILVSIVSLSNHIPAFVFILFMHESTSLIKIIGLLLSIPAIVLISLTMTNNNKSSTKAMEPLPMR